MTPDIIGLSGLITPSLDEMCYVAAEMEREGFDIPLLIGGATTSKVHTAVKIDPNYNRGQTIYVTDASRAVGVASNLISLENKGPYVADIQAEYKNIAERHAAKQDQKKRQSLVDARANKFPIQWTGYEPPRPSFLGTKSFDAYDLNELIAYIDWTPFFQTWELTGQYPAILDDNKVGEAARQLYDDAQEMLQRLVSENWLTAKGVIGFWPANTISEDDIVLYTKESREAELARLHTLRQQMVKTSGRANYALADFVAPVETGIADYIGAFAVTAGIGEDEKADAFKAAHDDYSAILFKALADRLAEAFAERMHERVRQELWGYARAESFSNEELIKEAYQGIRPAPGYPACPDHTEKGTLWTLLDVERGTGMKLTESFAMWPGASVSGLYFSHPEAAYFGVGKIERDQVEDYAQRKGFSLSEAEKWLAPNLNYTPGS